MEGMDADQEPIAEEAKKYWRERIAQETEQFSQLSPTEAAGQLADRIDRLRSFISERDPTWMSLPNKALIEDTRGLLIAMRDKKIGGELALKGNVLTILKQHDFVDSTDVTNLHLQDELLAILRYASQNGLTTDQAIADPVQDR